ncbi:unnamed protein product, partial [Prorocentrum cordatum]
MPDHQLRRLRREAGRALPGGRGAKSLTLQLALANEEPTYEATEAPIVRWARAVWETSSRAGRSEADPELDLGPTAPRAGRAGVNPERGAGSTSPRAGRSGTSLEHALDDTVDLLTKVWRRQQQEVGMKPMWAKVRGPAGAVIMSLKRAHWTWPTWHTVITKDGDELDMRKLCPMDVVAMLRKDVQRKPWQDWTAADEYASLRPAPMVAPAVAQLKARDFPKHAKNAARKAFIAGCWTMSKPSACNIVPTDICFACVEAVGTPHHRYFECQALRVQRLKAQPEWQTIAEQQEDSLLWTRGLVRHPEADWKFEGVDEGQVMCHAVEGDEDYFTGGIMCDGSKLGYSEWAQTGWAAMSINENGEPKYQMWGPLPCTLPVHRTIKRSEMWAFYMVLEQKLGEGNIYTDHQGIIEGLHKGERCCIGWKRPHADIWKRIWHEIRDLDLDVDGVIHVKARRSMSKIEQLTGAELKIAKGNAEVYLLAKVGAEMDANYGKHQAVEALAGRVRWAVQNTGWWPDVPKRERGRPLRRRPKPQIALTRHEVKEFGGWMWRVRCGRRAATQRMKRKLCEADCQPAPWTTAGARMSGMVGLGPAFTVPLARKGLSAKDDAKRKKRNRILAHKNPQTGKPLDHELQLPDESEDEGSRSSSSAAAPSREKRPPAKQQQKPPAPRQPKEQAKQPQRQKQQPAADHKKQPAAPGRPQQRPPQKEARPAAAQQKQAPPQQKPAAQKRPPPQQQAEGDSSSSEYTYSDGEGEEEEERSRTLKRTTTSRQHPRLPQRRAGRAASRPRGPRRPPSRRSRRRRGRRRGRPCSSPRGRSRRPRRADAKADEEREPAAEKDQRSAKQPASARAAEDTTRSKQAEVGKEPRKRDGAAAAEVARPKASVRSREEAPKQAEAKPKRGEEAPAGSGRRRASEPRAGARTRLLPEPRARRSGGFAPRWKSSRWTRPRRRGTPSRTRRLAGQLARRPRPLTEGRRNPRRIERQEVRGRPQRLEAKQRREGQGQPKGFREGAPEARQEQEQEQEQAEEAERQKEAGWPIERDCPAMPTLFEVQPRMEEIPQAAAGGRPGDLDAPVPEDAVDFAEDAAAVVAGQLAVAPDLLTKTLMLFGHNRILDLGKLVGWPVGAAEVVELRAALGRACGAPAGGAPRADAEGGEVAVRRACTLGAFERELAASFAGGAVGDWLRSVGSGPLGALASAQSWNPGAPPPPPGGCRARAAAGGSACSVRAWYLGTHEALFREVSHMWSRLHGFDVEFVRVNHQGIYRGDNPGAEEKPVAPRGAAAWPAEEKLRFRLASEEALDVQPAARRLRYLLRRATSPTDAAVLLCTIPAVVCAAFEGLALPIVMYAANPATAQVPFTAEKAWLSLLAKFAADQKNQLLVSNPWAQAQFEYQAGVALPVIRVHGLYTGARRKSGEGPPRGRALQVLVYDRVSPLLAGALEVLRASQAAEAEHSGGGAVPSGFVHQADTDREYATFASFGAVVFNPGDVEQMAFYEFYSMEMPLFMQQDPGRFLWPYIPFARRAPAPCGAYRDWAGTWELRFPEGHTERMTISCSGRVDVGGTRRGRLQPLGVMDDLLFTHVVQAEDGRSLQPRLRLLRDYAPPAGRPPR